MTVTFLRLRGVPGSFFALALVSCLGLAWIVLVGVDLERNSSGIIPVLVLAPAGAGAIASVATASPLAMIEATSPRHLGVLQALFVVGFLAVATSFLLPIGLLGHGQYGLSSVFRNTAGFIGLGVVGLRLFGDRAGWLVPMAYAIAMLAVEGATRSGALVAWPTSGSHDIASWIVAALALMTGLFSAATRVMSRSTVSLGADRLQ